MNGVDRLDILLGQFAEPHITLVAGIVDDYVDAPEMFRRRTDDRLATGGCGDRIVIGDRPAPCRPNFIDDSIRIVSRAAFAGGGAAEVVDDDCRSASRERPAIFTAEPATGTRHDRNPSGKVYGVDWRP